MRTNYLLLLTFFWMISCYGKSTAFYPGKTWLDQGGDPINAHGGQIIKVKNHYYWIGENRVAGRKNTGKIN